MCRRAAAANVKRALAKIGAARGFAAAYVTRLLEFLYESRAESARPTADPTLQRILDFCSEKDGVTTLSEISAHVHLDKYYVCHLFKEKTSLRLSAYLAQKRLAKCRALLNDKSLTVENVASLCGFSSPAAFSRFFKEHDGRTPTQYRRGGK